MFDKRFLYTGVAVITVAVLSFVLSKAPEKIEITPITEGVSGIERSVAPPSSSAPEQPDGYAYILKEYKGRIAVFSVGKTEPELVYDVLVKYLPDYDRLQMEKGIPVKDYSSLVSLIEDYIS